MYQPRTPGYVARDPVKRWALPDRVFFACGACHILAHVFLERYDRPGMGALWFRPAPGFLGTHVLVDGGGWLFDYHGYFERERYLARAFARARRRWPGWSAEVLELPREALVCEALSMTFPGLRLREPGQFLHDALPRARAFLDRFPAPPPPPHARAIAHEISQSTPSS